MLLIFDKDIGDAIWKACERDNFDNDALHLARAAQVVRRDMFDGKFTFNGSFKQGCQEAAVPQSLQPLINMILEVQHQASNCSRNQCNSSVNIPTPDFQQYKMPKI